MLFKNRKLNSTNLKLVTYCEEPLQILGYATCKVEHINNTYDLNMYVIDENRNTLLGREWIRQLSLDIWNVGIHNIHIANTNDKVRILLEKYCKVFAKKHRESRRYICKTANKRKYAT